MGDVKFRRISRTVVNTRIENICKEYRDEDNI
jgi:hypothetical protein